MKVVYIMRGVPGSGKSTRAMELAADGGIIHSTDSFFYNDGKYRFDKERLQEFHDKNFEAFCESIKNNIPIIVVDNTNTKHAHYARYVEAAKQAGYLVEIISLPHPTAEVAASRTLHNVSTQTIQQMIDEWEN
jgi:predicted ABC-type ATPase